MNRVYAIYHSQNPVLSNLRAIEKLPYWIVHESGHDPGPVKTAGERWVTNDKTKDSQIEKYKEKKIATFLSCLNEKSSKYDYI